MTQNIKIRKLLKTDTPYRIKWLNNPNINKFIGDELGQKTNHKKENEWFATYKKTKNKKFFTICDNSKPIGFMGLSNISKPNKNADLFIAIGEDEYRGKGIGKIAMNWLIDYGFKKLKLHKINLGVIKDNIPAVKLYKSLGFIIEGEMKDEVFNKGKFIIFYLWQFLTKIHKYYEPNNIKPLPPIRNLYQSGLLQRVPSKSSK